KHAMPLPKLDHSFPKAKKAGILLCERPIEPADLVILAIRIVITALGAPDFIAGDEHRNAACEQQQNGKVSYLAVAKPLDGPVIRLAFDPAVPAQVLVNTIAVTLTVRLVVLFVIRHDVIKRETVMTGYKVDAVDG